MRSVSQVAWMASVAVVVVATGGLAAETDRGRLVVKNHHVDNGGVYEEGAFQYLVLKRPDGSVVFRRRYPFGNTEMSRMFGAGRYRLVSYTRSCAGSCPQKNPPKCTSDPCPTGGYLDPSSGRCWKDFGLRRAERAVFVLRTAAGERCRLRRRS